MFCAVVAMTPNPALDDSDHGQNSGSEIGSFHLAKGHIRPMPRTQGTTMQKILAIMAGAGCLLALLDMPSEYYKALRFVVVVASVYAIVTLQRAYHSDGKKNALTTAFGLAAVLFNPLLPLEMERETWAFVNVATALLFLGYEFRGQLMDAKRYATNFWSVRLFPPYSEPECDFFRRGYADLAFAREHLSGECGVNLAQDNSDQRVRRLWNLQFFKWALGLRVDTDILFPQSAGIQKTAFGKEIGEDRLYEETGKALNSTRTSWVPLGEFGFDVSKSERDKRQSVRDIRYKVRRFGEWAYLFFVPVGILIGVPLLFIWIVDLLK
jgi:hypothetical protein